MLQGQDDEIHSASLYEDKNVFITIDFFSGHVSSIYFIKRKESSRLDFEILHIQHSVSINGKSAPFVSAYGFEPSILNFSENSMYGAEKRYKLEKQPKNVVESINLSLLINGTNVDISKEFLLRRVTYNHFQALQGI